MGICRVLLNAEGHDRQVQVKRLQHAVDDLKMLIQLGKDLKAFKYAQIPKEHLCGKIIY